MLSQSSTWIVRFLPVAVVAVLASAAVAVNQSTLAASVAPTPTPATRPVAPLPGSPDWFRDDTPAQFRRLDAAKQPIDPDHLDEPLLAAAIFQETNQQRADLQLPAFLPDEKASAAARLHSEWMARHHALFHDETSDQGPPVTALDRLGQQGLRPHATAENIAFNFALDLVPGKPFYARLENGRKVYSYQPGGAALRAYTYDGYARTVLAQWMHSPLHRAHLVDPDLRFLGVGAALARQPGHPDTIYATQDFYTPHPPSPSAMTSPAGATLLPTPPGR